MGHTMTFKDGFYTITLMREERVVYELEEKRMSLESSDDDTMPASTRKKILGPSYDGCVYFIREIVDRREGIYRHFWLSKEEYYTILPLYMELGDDDGCCSICEEYSRNRQRY